MLAGRVGELSRAGCAGVAEWAVLAAAPALLQASIQLVALELCLSGMASAVRVFELQIGSLR